MLRASMTPRIGARKLDPKILSYNLQQRRIALGYTKAQVARAAGMTPPAYLYIERGEVTPRPQALKRIARALHIAIKQLGAPVRPLQAVRFRVERRIKDRAGLMVQAASWLRDYVDLEDSLGVAQPSPILKVRKKIAALPPGPERARTAAGLVRKALGLSPLDRIWSLSDVIEEHGVKLFLFRAATANLYSFSIGEADRGPVIAVNCWESMTTERRILSAAREVAHLVLHPDSYDVAEVEEDQGEADEADEFASHLLIPQELLEKEWTHNQGLPLVARVIRTKRVFRVGYRRILMRLEGPRKKKNGLIEEFLAQYQQAMGRDLAESSEPAESSRGSRSELRGSEPARVSSWEFVPGRLSRLAEQAMQRGLMERSDGLAIQSREMDKIRRMVMEWAE